MRPWRVQILRKQRPGLFGMSLGEREKREVAAAKRRSSVGDDRPQSGNSPPRADERGGRGMLPPLQLGNAERDDVRIGERATAFQYGKKPAIHLGERGFECFGVSAPGERQRFPTDLTEIQVLPHLIQRGGIARGQQTFEPRRK